MSHSAYIQPNVTNGSMRSSDPTRTASNVGKSWRILHVESSMEMGGQEYRVLEESLGMVNRGHTVIVAVPKGSQMASLAKQKELSIELTSSGKAAWINLVLIYLRIIRHHRVQIVNRSKPG